MGWIIAGDDSARYHCFIIAIRKSEILENGERSSDPDHVAFL